MPKNRMVRPEMWTDDKFVGLSPLARLLFVGMWNFACDNGHLDDSGLQLKMRILPADNTEIDTLLDEILLTGMVVRKDGFLKVVKLSEKQPLDVRYLQFCDHCDEDGERRYDRTDRPGGGQNAGGTRASRVQPASPRRRGVGVGVGDGDVEDAPAGKPAVRAAKLPKDWKPTPEHEERALAAGLVLGREVDKFRAHADERGRTAKNWNAAFTRWLMNAEDYAARDRVGTAATRTLPRADQIEEPPPGLDAEAYDRWYRGQVAKRKVAGQ